MLIFIPVLLLRMLGAKRCAVRLINTTVMLWSRNMLFMLGADVTVVGREHVPMSDKLCVVANHQSYGDSLLLQAHLGRTVGFVADLIIDPLGVVLRFNSFKRNGQAD